MNSENGDDKDLESGKYLLRRRFYVPKSEVERFYGRKGELNVNDVLLPCDFYEGDD
jgi:hypothetical protein